MWEVPRSWPVSLFKAKRAEQHTNGKKQLRDKNHKVGASADIEGNVYGIRA